ncbi:cell cycle transcriptional regulator TrcR [Thioclava litoralis]|uniref:Cell cycle transcriptional regulator TrcR n=1 Tax=Thioclava litoralis TaxID=3076557 RepID=A0ABZ1E4D3_9RHOB|nr:cell cycle transcriptional regulator TrcR [Thioclava sp. FTW29]
MTNKPLMARATAVWLVDNTTLSFKQIGDFTGMHELEIQGIADGDVAVGVKGQDPVAHGQLDASEIEKGEKDALYKLKLKFNKAAVGEDKRRGPRYTPLSKRQDRPNAILWLVKFHPELADAQIARLVGTTKPTIASIRERTHWNIQNMTAIDPVALGLCRQSELDMEVQKAAKKAAAMGVMTDDERRKLVSTEQSLEMSDEPRLPSSIAGLENFSLSKPEDDDERKSPADYSDADSFFNLPHGDDDEEEEDERR